MRDVNMNPIRSIDRAIDVLQAFSVEKPSITLDELAKITKIPRSTVYRILCTLEKRGLVRFDPNLLAYKPGLRLIEFGLLLSSTLDVHQEAEEILIDLQNKTSQTVVMAVKEGEQILYIFKRENDEGLKFSSLVGQRRPYIYGVLGPILLAFLPDNQMERILSAPVYQHTPYTVTDKNMILQRLLKVREEHFYMEANETYIGVIGVGAPIFDVNGEVIAAIGLIGPTVQLVDDELDQAKHLLINAAEMISKKMGHKKAH